VKRWTILIIFGTQRCEETGRKWLWFCPLYLTLILLLHYRVKFRNRSFNRLQQGIHNR